MSTILNIETSGKICSAAITRDGCLEYQLDEPKEMQHANVLAPFVDKCMNELHRKEEKLDAVAVSIGPGSYTGLRIGLSLAKGLAFSLDVPLIGVDTLKILAVKAMFRSMEWTGDEILVPMIDARRMEVYTAPYNFRLEPLVPPSPMIIDENSFSNLIGNHKLILIGDGAEKAARIIKHPNVQWIPGLVPMAKDMLALSEKAFRENDFIDIAYSVPNYLKDYITTTPKSKL
ncbi:MAG: tRNA (adenosine(37)-N6)-threonylcarbamoyltransferase complex dimerization subunit type 1 TsaB [Candidatus Amulumruptor caecigallinarius]|nr:tRNA (adenosine(37)-N6)-threonylcarbamoyltransferase complex dimerization subunit type 1 TsaB [Candidatus Amulumruptor caecigallinarius]